MEQRVYGRRVLVDLADVGRARVDDAGAVPTLDEGHAVFAVERVALTANNVTYALMGDVMGYWRFFAAPDGRGQVPAWGVARCVASETAGVAVGQRFYGFWPLAERLVMPVALEDGGFRDPSPHRQGLADVYNRYERRGELDPTRDGVEALFRPLFMTGWLLDRWLDLEGDFGAARIALSSASSKTAIGTAWSLRQRGDGPALVGLTSARHLDFVRGLGFYDDVLAYDAAGELEAGVPTVFVDLAGDRALRASVHRRLGDALHRSVAVGIAHGRPDEAVEVPGQEAEFFFAPRAAAQLQTTMGAAPFAAAIGGAWRAFALEAESLVRVDTRVGVDAARDAFAALASGTIGGATSLVVEL